MPNETVSPQPAADLISAFIRYQAVERGLLPGSLQTYESALRLIATSLGCPLDQATVDQLRDRYVHNPKTVAKAPKTIARERSTLRSFYTWLQDEQAADPAAKQRYAEVITYLKKLKSPRGQRLPQVLTPAEIGRIRESLRQCEATSSPVARQRLVRDQAIFELLLGAALRKAELLGLRPDDVLEKPDPSGRGTTWLKIRGKGNKERMVPLRSPAVEALTRYLASRPSSPEWLFGLSPYAINLVVYRITAAAGVKRVRVHDLRHTAVSLLIENGVPMPIVQIFVGHSSIATTALYTHLSPDSVQKALAQCQI